MSQWRKWNGHTVFCGKCREYEVRWIQVSTGIGVCKYCHVDERGLQHPVPAYLKEAIPLD